MMTIVTTTLKFFKKVGKTFENRNGNGVSLQHQKTRHQASKRDAPRCKRQRTKVHPTFQFLSNSTMLGVSIREKSDVQVKFFVEKMRETQDF